MSLYEIAVPGRGSPRFFWMSASYAILAAVASDDDLPNAQILSWDLKTGVPLSQHLWREAAIQDATLLPSRTNPLMPSHFLSTALRTSAIHIHALQKERPVARWYGHERVGCVAASADGRWVAAGNEGGAVMVWEVETGRLWAQLADAHLRKVNRVRFTRDGGALVSVSEDGFAKVWSLESLLQGASSATPLFAFSDHSQGVIDVHLGFGRSFRSSRMLTCSTDGSCILYDLADGALLARYAFPAQLTGCLMTATETMILAASTSGDIFLVDLASDGVEVGQEASVMLSADGKRREQRLVGPNGASITRMCFTADEAFLLAGDASGHVAVWNVEGRMITRQIATHTLVPSGSIRWLEVVPKAALTRTEPVHSFGQLRRAIDMDATHSMDTMVFNKTSFAVKSQAEPKQQSTSELEELREENRKLREAHKKLLESIQESL